MSERPRRDRYPLGYEGRKAYWRALDRWRRDNPGAETTPGDPPASTEAGAQSAKHPTYQAGPTRPAEPNTRNHEGHAMSAHVTIIGNLGRKPEIAYTNTGKPVTTLSIACTPARQEKNSGQWTDDGDPLWIRAPFWGDEHTYLADALDKGACIAVDGTLVRRTYQRKDGSTGEALEVKFPRFLGVIPRRPQQGTQSQGAPLTPSGYQAPPADTGHPWGAPTEPPF